MLNQDTITNALKSVKYPGYSRDIISFGIVKNVAANNGAVSVTIELTSANKDIAAQLKQACEQAIRALPEAKMVHIEVKMPNANVTGNFFERQGLVSMSSWCLSVFKVAPRAASSPT